MNKIVTKKESLFKEALVWMSYRYAMGMTDYVGRKGYSELERYRQFMDIEFGSDEFRALVNAFCDFLKRKKITDVITLKENYLEQDLIWLSKNYAMGRHSYAASHWQDIVRYSQDVLTEDQKKHNAMDIRREISMHLQFQDFNFRMPHYLEEIHSPLDLFLTFITENGIDTVKKLLQYKRIEVIINNDGHIEYATTLRDDSEKKDIHFWPMASIDDYLGWDALASFFYPPCHKVCRTHFNGKEELIPYIDAWQYDYTGEGKLKYKKVKRPLDKFRIEPWAAWSINEECIVEDNIENQASRTIENTLYDSSL